MYTLPLKFSADFVARVKKLYPYYPQLHQALDSGSDNVGLYLDANCSGKMDCADILKATSLRELKAKAKLELQRLELYNEYCRIIRGC